MDFKELQEREVRVYRALRRVSDRILKSKTRNSLDSRGPFGRFFRILGGMSIAVLIACSTIPNPKHKEFKYPASFAFTGDVKRPYTALGLVRSKVNFESLDPNKEETTLCKNYFNKSVRELVKYAKERGGDAVIDIKSVVFLEDGRAELYPTAECSDDGQEGQILTQGIAVRWKREPISPSPSPSPSPLPPLSSNLEKKR